MQTSQMVFYFEDPIAFLNAQLRERQKKNPKFSLRAWARQMGYQNPSLLFQVLKGQRRLKMDLAIKIATNLSLKGKALRYFELIVLNSSCQSDAERRVFTASMAKLRPKKFPIINNLSLEMFSAVADWYHWAILHMTELPDFVNDITWIQERLGGGLDKKTIKAGIERLLQLGLLVQAEGKLTRCEDDGNPLFMQNDVPSAAVRQFHAQMIEKALAAVEQQTVDERLLRGTTLAFNIRDLSQASEIIAEAHRQLIELAATSSADPEDIYHLNTQFFRLTKKKVERAH